jgi:hypothetical protein
MHQLHHMQQIILSQLLQSLSQLLHIHILLLAALLLLLGCDTTCRALLDAVLDADAEDFEGG